MLTVGLLSAGIAFGGCGDQEEKNPDAVPSEAGGTVSAGEDGENDENETKTEPALSEEAKKQKQFADPAEGELYAKINIQDFGTITVKFFPEEAPLAVENFVTHAREGYYDGVTFHRILDDFMIQGGDPEGTGRGGASIWGKDFADEFADELHPLRGALCMANIGEPNTNSSQFFIVQADASTIAEMERLLDARFEVKLKEYIKAGYGTELSDEQVELYETYGGTPWLFRHHTVFGQVLDGYEVLDAVAGVKADKNGSPEKAVFIESVEILSWEGQQEE
ncbi:MAG: peptidylprolyl isomerase [Lachnospiraceae bacterium]|nr:peptidylprolyl isomerase [Lachnospiraceae bacterium]